MHAPARVGALMRDALEELARDSEGAAERRLMTSLASIANEAAPSDLLQAAAAIAANRPRSGARQLLVDVTALAGAAGPISAAELAQVRSLVLGAPHGWRVEPVRHDGSRFRYARRFSLDLIGRTDLQLEDTTVDVGPGDLALALASGGASFPPSWPARGVALCRLEGGLPVAEEAAVPSWLGHALGEHGARAVPQPG